jgi:hypothetical protein
MKRAIAMALLASTLFAGLANAQPSSHAPAAPREEPDAGSARAIDSPYLAVPVVRGGQLRNYLFVSVRIDIAQGVDLWRTREKAHFLRDALVRASHQNVLADPSNDNALNEARAIQVYRAAAIQVLGERAVGPVSIISTYSTRGV